VRFLFVAVLLLLVQPAYAAERILALTPHVCEILYAIGAGSKVVGAGAHCDYPAAAGKLPRVGNFDRINVEAALRLHPDAAVVMGGGVKGVQLLQDMGVSIVVSHPRSFEGVFDDIIRIGVLAEHAQEAEMLVASLRTRLDRVRAMKRNEIPVFYEIWADPMLTAGGPSFINNLIREAGGRNVFADIDIETPHVNVESVLRAAPEVIIVPLEGRSIEQRRTFWEGWIGKGSVRFVSIDPDLLHRPGPRLLDGLEQLQKALSQGGKK
jgi:ABC-type Fe3+-hydroxamate transport system substrate-binding protein